MDIDERKDYGTIRGEGRSGPVLSCLSIFFSFIRILIEEGIMAPISLLKLLASSVDPNMAIWIFVVMIAGYWLKRTELPQWIPPLPVLLLAMYLVIGFAFGWMQYGVESWGGLLWVLLYGAGNGIVYTGFSFIIYDIGHNSLKKSRARKTAGENADKEAAGK